MRLINADTLKEECIDVLVGGGNYESAVLLEDITNAPTIDAVPTDFAERCLQIEIDKHMNMVEVVRCKDCIHKVLTEDGEYNPEDIVCNYWASDGLEDTDYCSYGERREP